jgi:transposase
LTAGAANISAAGRLNAGRLVGASAATLMPLRDAIETHAHAAERLHVDDTTVSVLAKGQCRTGRLWSHVRHDRTFGGGRRCVLLLGPSRGRAL